RNCPKTRPLTSTIFLRKFPPSPCPLPPAEREEGRRARNLWTGNGTSGESLHFDLGTNQFSHGGLPLFVGGHLAHLIPARFENNRLGPGKRFDAGHEEWRVAAVANDESLGRGD